jgi:hypothetical protein
MMVSFLEGTMPAPTMPTGFGAFCWNQLNTPDVAASKAFYEGLFGWRIVEESMGGATLYVISSGSTMVGDMMVMPAESTAPSHWLSYVWVKDIGEVVAKAAARGATIFVPVTEIPEVGRIAVFADPRGAVLGVYATDKEPGSPEPIGPGTFCWHECMTRNLEGGKAFYADLFGWTSVAQTMEGGFVYHLQHRGADQVAGMMAMDGDCWEGIPDHWMAYVAVTDIEATVAKVAPLGGTVCVPVTDIHIGRFAVIQDAIGATISVFQGKEASCE